MKFKVLNTYKNVEGTLLVSGCYIPEDDNEKILIIELKEALDEVSTIVSSNSFTTNDKTILFKSVPLENLFLVLQLHNSAFPLHLRVVFGKNMKTNHCKEEVEHYFSTHSL